MMTTTTSLTDVLTNALLEGYALQEDANEIAITLKERMKAVSTATEPLFFRSALKGFA